MKMRAFLFAIGSLLLAGHAEPTQRKSNPHGDISMKCSDCHSEKRWKPTKRLLDFDHGKTGFPLAGSHSSVSCMDCHKDLKFHSVGSSCADCHNDIHQGKFGTDCQACHTPKKWSAEFLTQEGRAHTRFPLVGSHAIDDCAKCHKNQEPRNYANTPTDCISCHLADFNKTRSPNHRALNYSTDCASCHTSGILSGWRGGAAGMKHPASLPLTGAHGKISCYECHRKDTYAGLNPDCATCHQDDFDRSTRPSHKELAFPTNCATCHTNENWRATSIPEGTGFKHPETFPLTGGHAKPKCAECHAQGFVGTKAECVGCHEKDFQATTQPNHVEQKFSQDCRQCHGIGQWKGALIPPGGDFKHPATFPLAGGHAQASCTECHANGYANTPVDCIACHKADFDKSTNPRHADLNFSTNCKECHTINSWQGARIPPGSTFQHPGTFPLTGGHARISCAECHANGYVNTSAECAACHKADFDKTANPRHADLNFSTNCKECHTVNAWQGANIPPGTSFQHPAAFPLSGGHAKVSCTECHANGYTNTPRDCNSCHDDDYLKAVPNHTDLRLPKDCALCHSNATWTGANIPPNIPINHPAAFPLTRPHDKATCVQCHSAGYTKTPTDCYSCHRSDYEAVKSPNHVTANYSKDCLSCHKRETWDGASFDHERFFPISRGRHSGFQCNACHVVSDNYKAFECIQCHAHSNKASVDGDHRGVRNYRYTSEGCYSCHPQGRD